MRILELIDWLPPYHDGGDGILAETFCTKLVRLGHKVIVLTNLKAYRAEDITKEASEEYKGYSIIKYPEDITPYFIEQLESIDVIHAHQINNLTMLSGLNISKDIPIIFHCHIDFEKYNQICPEPDFDINLYLTMQKSMLARVTAVVCHSDLVKESLIRQGVLPDRIFCIDPMLDIYLPLSFEKPSEPILVATGGRLEDKTKGLEGTVRAFEIASEYSSREIKLLIIGTISQIQQYEVIKRLGNRVEFVGWFSNRKKYSRELSRASIFCSLSPIESFGLMLMEAVALGLVPICVRTGEAAKLIEIKKLGYVFKIEKGDHELLVKQAAEAILTLVKEPIRLEKLSKRCRYVALRYLEKNSANALVEIMQICMRQKNTYDQSIVDL